MLHAPQNPHLPAALRPAASPVKITGEVNPGKCLRLLSGADYAEGEIQGGEVWDEEAGGFFEGEVVRDAFDHAAVVEAAVFVALGLESDAPAQ